MLAEIRRKLVKVRRDLDLAAQRPVGVSERATTRQGHKPRDRSPGALDDDLLAALGEIHEP